MESDKLQIMVRKVQKHLIQKINLLKNDPSQEKIDDFANMILALQEEFSKDDENLECLQVDEVYNQFLELDLGNS